MEIPRNDPFNTHLAEGHWLAAGAGPEIGGCGRLDNVGDGNISVAAGIPSLQYGPGDIRN